MTEIPKAVEAIVALLLGNANLPETTAYELAERIAALPHLASAQPQPNKSDEEWWSRSTIDRLRIRAKDDADLLMLILAYDQSFKKVAQARAAALAECELVAREWPCKECDHEICAGEVADAIAALRAPVADPKDEEPEA